MLLQSMKYVESVCFGLNFCVYRSQSALKHLQICLVLVSSLNDTAGWLWPLKHNSEALLNNNIAESNNHLLLPHEKGNKSHLNCGFRSPLAEVRLWEVNQRLEFVFLHQRGRRREAVCCSIHRVRLWYSGRKLCIWFYHYSVATPVSSLLYCLNLLTSRSANSDLSFRSDSVRRGEFRSVNWPHTLSKITEHLMQNF